MSKLWTIILMWGLCTLRVEGHGRLWDPPSRSSMWKKGYSTPVNYNDNQLFCGGFAHQWYSQHGKCGICGDPYDQASPRDNEAGGKYGRGIITRKYKEGQIIEVDVEVTANHLGFFEFRICSNNDVKKVATQECLDKHLLQLADGSGTKYYITSAVGHFKVKLQLPRGLVCTQCVLQWKWHVGNSWGTNKIDGRSCIGCGPQEEFYGCADVAITGSLSPVIINAPTTPATTATTSTTTTPTPTTTTTTTTPTTTTPTTTTTTPTTTTTTPTTTTTTPTTTTTTPTTTTTSTTTTTTPTTTTARPTTTTAKPTTARHPRTHAPTNTPSPTTRQPYPYNPNQTPYLGRKCIPTVTYAQVKGMNWWCRVNCAAGYCPATHCRCI